MIDCPFCHRIASGDYSSSTELAVAFKDAFPVASGHTLIVPRRHEADYFGLSVEEQSAVMDLARGIQAEIRESTGTSAMTVGINIGAAAGQTIWHAHLHLIPRVEGDVPDPRGGVRWVIPGNAAYWEQRTLADRLQPCSRASALSLAD